MKLFKLSSLTLYFFGVLYLGLLCRNAYAYLDPGSGSYLLQILMAGLLAASFMFKSFWQGVIRFFSKIFSRKKKDAKDHS